MPVLSLCDTAGSANSFGFAIYSHARDRYEDALLLTGHPPRKPSTPRAPSTSPASSTDRELTPNELTGLPTKLPVDDVA